MGQTILAETREPSGGEEEHLWTMPALSGTDIERFFPRGYESHLSKLQERNSDLRLDAQERQQLTDLGEALEHYPGSSVIAVHVSGDESHPDSLAERRGSHVAGALAGLARHEIYAVYDTTISEDRVDVLVLSSLCVDPDKASHVYRSLALLKSHGVVLVQREGGLMVMPGVGEIAHALGETQQVD